VFDAQTYDDAIALQQRTTTSTPSNDSGFDVDETLTPHDDDNTTSPLIAAINNNDVFHPPSPNYILLDDVMSSERSPAAQTRMPVMSPTDYVIVCIGDEDKSVLPLRSVDAHQLLHVDVHAQSAPQQDAQHLATSGVDVSCHSNAASASTNEKLTTEVMPSNEDEHGSVPAVSAASAMTTCPLDASQPDERDDQANAVRPVESPYIQLQALPSSNFPSKTPHSNDSAV